MRDMQVYNDPNAMPEKPPIFRKGFPTVILILAGAIIGVSLVQFNASDQLQNWMFATAAVAGGPSFENVYRPWGEFAPYVLHTFLHGGSFHLMMNMAMLIALGPIVANVLGNSIKRSEEHTSELQSRETISYAVFCLKKKKTKYTKARAAHTHSL